MTRENATRDRCHVPGKIQAGLRHLGGVLHKGHANLLHDEPLSLSRSEARDGSRGNLPARKNNKKKSAGTSCQRQVDTGACPSIHFKGQVKSWIVEGEGR